jgi:sugar lactone lactonase YvrE
MNTDKTLPTNRGSRWLPGLRAVRSGALVLALIAPAVAAGEGPAGSLTQLGGLDACVAETGAGGDCTDGVGLVGSHGVAVSPDGKHVYVASSAGNSVAAFAADRSTGALTQLPGLAACVSEDGSGGHCRDGVALAGARSVAVSPDGKHLYVASFQPGAFAAFARD